MTEFKASAVAFEVQKSFANKFFSNKTVAKTLIDETSSHLLDNLYLLLYVFVSIQRPHWSSTPDKADNCWSMSSLLISFNLSDQEQEGVREDNQKYYKDLHKAGDVATWGEAY